MNSLNSQMNNSGKFLEKMKVILSMKNHLICVLASALIVSVSLISCEPNPEPKDVELDIFVLNISQETDWNYMVVGEDGSIILFNVNQLTEVPTLLYYKPEKDSDDGFTYLFKENGLLDKMIHNGHVLYFGNFNKYTFDLAIIYPDGTIEYHYDIKTDINWDAHPKMSSSGQAHFNFNSIRKILGIIGHAIEVGTTATSEFYPPARFGSDSYVANEVANVVAGQVFNGFTENVSTEIINVIGCDGSGVAGAIDYVSGLTDAINQQTDNDLDITDQKNTEINEAIRLIDGDALTTTIPHALLGSFLDLGIEINKGRNPPNIEGSYLATPLQLAKNTAGGSIADQSDMYVTFSEQKNTSLTISADYMMQTMLGTTYSSGTDAFLVGEDNKFTVFMDAIRAQGGYTAKTVEVFSGEMTDAGISNFQWAVFMVDDRGDPLDLWIPNGTGYFKKDNDGFSERLNTQGRQVIIDMYVNSFTSSGWDHNGALRININGANNSNARLNYGGHGSCWFYVDTGDVVNIYWTGNTGNYHRYNAFIMYYADTPPDPVFNQTSWNGNNALLFRLRNSLSNEDIDQLLGSFTATAMAAPKVAPSILPGQRSINVLPSIVNLSETYTGRQ